LVIEQIRARDQADQAGGDDVRIAVTTKGIARPSPGCGRRFNS
jgi:hypothetical protein